MLRTYKLESLSYQIEYVFFLMESLSSRFDKLTPISRRMYATGIANELYSLISLLTIIDEQIDSSLSFADAYLELSLWEGRSLDIHDLLNEKMYEEGSQNDADINNLIDIFPLNKDEYTFTSEKAERLKTGLRYLCSDANIAPRDLVYALEKGIKSIFSLLHSIKQKKSNIKDYQWEDFWYDFLYRDDDLYPEEAINDYEQWKEEHDYQDIQVLEDKRTQEILKLLNSGIFNYDTVPFKRDIDNCIIKISEDALEEGTEIPENTRIECARFSKYVTFKDRILCLDYKKLGKYIYKHYSQIRDEQGDRLIYFDYMLLHIQDDMAECNPNLKKYLKFYEDDLLDSVFNNALTVIESCKDLLKEGVPQDFLSSYLRKAFYGENKIEVQAKLNGQSKYTLLCNMLGMLKSTKKVFKLDVTSSDLASSLASVVQKPREDSLKRYIDAGASDLRSKLSKWTTQYVVDQLGSASERLFVKISQK